jgi:hypothetical protein
MIGACTHGLHRLLRGRHGVQAPYDLGIERVNNSGNVIFNKNRGWKLTSDVSIDEPLAQQEFVFKFYTAPVLEINNDEGAPEGGRMHHCSCMMFYSQSQGLHYEWLK